MITHIRMKNFKSWADSGEVQLAPLTGFFGTNSSGKSSLLQMLLLLKQTVDSNEILFFGDEDSHVNLGDFREVIHGHNVEELLELEFGCSLHNPFTIEVFGRKPEGQGGNVLVPIDNFTFNSSIRGVKGNLNVEHFRYSVESCDFTGVKWEREQLSYIDLVNPQHLIGMSIKNCYGRSPIGDSILKPLVTAFERLFSHIHPLGPTRVDPQRHYHWEGTHPESVGQNGLNAIDALLSARVDQQTTPYEDKNVRIEDRISAWLQDMDLAYSFSLKRANSGTDRNYDVLIQKGPASAQVALADMGYGLSQFLPVLVHCYYVPEGSTLILEQPGIHLHPMVQSQIADLLIEVVNERKLQILVESHSEHLLNRLQRRIAEEKVSVEKTALYFCRNDKGVSNIERLKMDAFGNISNWPENFFGNEMGDLFAMTKAQSERRKRAEG